MLNSYYPISTMVHVLIDVDDGPYELTWTNTGLLSPAILLTILNHD